MDCHNLVAPRVLEAVISENTLKVFHMNCCSLINTTDELQSLFNALSFDFYVNMFSETWYNIESNYFVLQNSMHFILNI